MGAPFFIYLMVKGATGNDADSERPDSLRKDRCPCFAGDILHGGERRFLSVLGANGAGKSTLFRCLLGGLTDYTGAIELDGRRAYPARRETAGHIAFPRYRRPPSAIRCWTPR